MKLVEFKKSLAKTQAVIIVGPKKDKLKAISKKDIPVIFVDGGIQFKNFFQSNESISIGDGDSTSKKMDVKLNPKKDISDFKAALNLLPKNIKYILLRGLFPKLSSEKYFDYLLANLGEAYQIAIRNQAYIELNENSYILPKGTHSLMINHEFSIFSLVEQKISIKGNCVYRLEKKTKISFLSSIGLSNIGFGLINIQNELPLIIIERKN